MAAKESFRANCRKNPRELGRFARRWRPPPDRLRPSMKGVNARRAGESPRMKIAVRFSLQRIAALDRAIRAGEYPNAWTIARELEVGHRTVQRDVEFLRDR